MGECRCHAGKCEKAWVPVEFAKAFGWVTNDEL
jgi:SH3-like domain-containing protein